MNKNKWMTMAAVLALSTSMAIAAPNGGERDGRAGGRRDRGDFSANFGDKLNLTDAQKHKINTIRINNREQNKAFFEQSRETFQQFHEAKKANDTARLEQLKPEVERHHAQMQQLHEAERQQILAVLTPEQRARFDALRAEQETRRGQRGERGPRGNGHGSNKH